MCWGVPFGWIPTVRNRNLEIQALNVFRKDLVKNSDKIFTKFDGIFINDISQF